MIKRYRTSLSQRLPSQPAPSKPDVLADRLFDALDARLACTPLCQARVLLVGFTAQDRAELRRFVRLAGARMTAATASTAALADDPGLCHYSHLLVDLDAFPDLEDAVETLCAYRERHPGQIVILLGRELTGDDHGTERAPIADASLRLPVNLPRLTRALFAAGANALSRTGYLRTQ